MIRLPLFPDAALWLDPSAAGLPWIVSVLLLPIPVILVLVLYRTEARLAPRPAAIALMVLRGLVVLLAVTVWLFQPVLSLSSRQARPGRVIVAVDRSASMAVADPNRDAACKFRIAAALKLARDLATDAELRAAASTGSAGTLPEVVNRIDAITRADLARAVIRADGAGLLDRLAKRHAVDLVGFADALAELSPAALDSPPTGKATDMTLPLRRAVEAGEPPVAVILLGDGRHTAEASPGKLAGELGRAGVPVYALELAADTPPVDAAVSAVRAPATVFLKSEIEVEASVRLRGVPAGVVPVELRVSGEDPQIETVAHPGGDQLHAARFRVRGREPGPLELTVRVPPLPAEVHTHNNCKSVTVIVADDTAKVLVIDGEARWEYHYLTALLARDAGVKTAAVLFRPPRTGRMTDGELTRLGYPAVRLPEGDGSLDGLDAIVLGDVSPADLPPADRLRLERYVADAGGTLVIQAGHRFMPHAYPADDDPLARLLPITEAKPIDPPGGANWDLTPEGRSAAFLRMEPTPAESDQRWAKLPPHFWGTVGRAKPGAEVLARFTGRQPVDPRRYALVARQSYGFGRVLYVGVDSTWRWRFRAGDLYHHRFWGQVVRWAASDKPLMAGDERVRFGPRRAVVAAGQEVEVTVRYAAAADPPPPGSLAAVRASRGGTPVGLAALEPVEAGPREFRARLRDLPPGHFDLELIAPGTEGLGRAAVRVAEADSAELADLSGDGELLRQLTSATGGKCLPCDRAAELADEVAARSTVVPVQQEIRTARSALTLLLFIGLIGSEWVLRKWSGLP